MPIYAYKCESCGAAKDVLQKISDPALTDCPACGQPTFRKQVTAAGFQLKGSGWYATDFRGSTPAAAGTATAAAGSTASAVSGEAPAAAAPAASHGCSSDCSCG
jgi:putative FmdB family regulatory protein